MADVQAVTHGFTALQTYCLYHPRGTLESTTCMLQLFGGGCSLEESVTQCDTAFDLWSAAYHRHGCWAFWRVPDQCALHAAPLFLVVSEHATATCAVHEEDFYMSSASKADRLLHGSRPLHDVKNICIITFVMTRENSMDRDVHIIELRLSIHVTTKTSGAAMYASHLHMHHVQSRLCQQHCNTTCGRCYMAIATARCAACCL